MGRDIEEKAKERARRDKAFQRRSQAAKDGIHLPTTFELYRNSPFCEGSLFPDAQLFSERLLPHVKGTTEASELARAHLRGMSISQQGWFFHQAAENFERVREEDAARNHKLWGEARRRCHYYAAILGYRPSMLVVGGEMLHLASDIATFAEVAVEYGEQAIGWLKLATLSSIIDDGYRLGRDTARDNGRYFLTKLLACRDVSIATAAQLTAVAEAKEAAELTPTTDPAMPENGSLTVVVVPKLGNSDLHEGKRIAKEFGEILGKGLPLVSPPDLGQASVELDNTFPHAKSITAAIMSDLRGKPAVRMRPTLFFGPPGSGKSAYAEHLLDVLGVPSESYHCGGISDSSLAGTARRWQSAQPSLPLSIVRRNACASPGIILDELEKGGSGTVNGRLSDALLALVETRSAMAWHDPYIEAPVNLSHVIWIATTNDMKALPPALRDRFRCFKFPVPSHEHMRQIAKRMLGSLVERQGLHNYWAEGFDLDELRAMEKIWTDGSLRSLERIVAAVLAARDRGRSIH